VRPARASAYDYELRINEIQSIIRQLKNDIASVSCKADSSSGRSPSAPPDS
jgi:hypothetical protein